jgi:hypothetical protein
MNIFTNHPYITASVLALVLNMPLGYMRAKSRKYSIQWVLWIHASIPFIVWFRIANDLENWIIAVNIVLAILGQLLGSYLLHRRAQKG